MNAEQIFPILKRILVEQLGVRDEHVVAAATFDDLGVDSLDHVEIIIAIEEEFSIDITNEDAERIQTVQQALDFLVVELS